MAFRNVYVQNDVHIKIRNEQLVVQTEEEKVITEKQYENVDIFLGKKSKYEKTIEYETLSFFKKRNIL